MSERQRGPVDDVAWPEELAARVVLPGDEPRVHGYDVQSDLATHYRFGETLLIYLGGEAPDQDRGRAFEIAMTFASVLDAGEAPAHAGIVARMCGAPASGVVAVAATALTERNRVIVSNHRELFAWLALGDAALPSTCRARDDGDRAATVRLRRALPASFANASVFSRDPSKEACVIATLFACGLQRPEQVEAALTIATLASACAEAFAATPGDFRGYPMNTPKFEYVP